MYIKLLASVAPVSFPSIERQVMVQNLFFKLKSMVCSSALVAVKMHCGNTSQ